VREPSQESVARVAIILSLARKEPMKLVASEKHEHFLATSEARR
jgi:hypothetical protein